MTRCWTMRNGKTGFIMLFFLLPRNNCQMTNVIQHDAAKTRTVIIAGLFQLYCITLTDSKPQICIIEAARMSKIPIKSML
jgi:hypothetical protein